MLEFKLPEIGEGVIEGEIVRWILKPGDAFAPNDAVVEVMTDKATIEVPAPMGGVLVEHRANEGQICAVGQVIAMVDESAGASAAPAAASATHASTPSHTPTVRHEGPVLATPAARHLARAEGIDLGSLPLGDRGRITKEDVLAERERVEAEKRTPAPAHSPAPSPTPAAAPTARAESPTRTPEPPTTPVARSTVVGDRQDERIPFRGIRRKIAEGLHRSYSTAVHYTYVETIDVTRLVALRDEAKDLAKEQGVSLSYLPFIVKAVCHALKKFPIVNASLDTERSEIVVRKRYHIGIAAATDQGLMVPVVHDADLLSLLDLAREIKRLGEGAKAGKLAREELTGSTFSITSLGQIGGLLATPILNFPEVGILGVHAIRKVPVVDDSDGTDRIRVGHQMNLSISLDHRIVDGFEGANFLQEVRRYLERPNLLLLSGI
jgi:pyruvate dehydrogenase E2 component (dihydrolipoamide acetyltransferase)